VFGYLKSKVLNGTTGVFKGGRDSAVCKGAFHSAGLTSQRPVGLTEKKMEIIKLGQLKGLTFLCSLPESTTYSMGTSK